MVCSDGLYEENHMLPMKKRDFTCLEPVPENPLEEDRAITRGLMILSERTLAPILENEPDIYTVEDLKVRFR
jgi:hypothetical protein